MLLRDTRFLRQPGLDVDRPLQYILRAQQLELRQLKFVLVNLVQIKICEYTIEVCEVVEIR